MVAGETSPALDDTGLHDATLPFAHRLFDLARGGHTDELAAQVGSEGVQ